MNWFLYRYELVTCTLRYWATAIYSKIRLGKYAALMQVIDDMVYKAKLRNIVARYKMNL
jgi:hypothetical protein